MSKKDGGGGYVQTFDFASKTVTMEENDHFSEEEADNFIEFKADNKIPSIKVKYNSFYHLKNRVLFATKIYNSLKYKSLVFSRSKSSHQHTCNRYYKVYLMKI